MKKERMIRTAAGLLCAACLLVMGGCGSSGERVITGDVNNNVTGGTATPTQGTGASSGKDSGTQAADSRKGYIFLYKGCELAMNADMASILPSLGEPVSYFEAASCAFEGLDKIYTFSGLEIDTYPEGEKDFLSAVILKDDSIATPEGIYIGSSKADLLKAYGENYQEENGMIVYRKEGMKLCFIVTDDSVSSIQYFSTVLEE